MRRLHLHPEGHLVSRIGWLRAAVLGANDGIVLTANLILGVTGTASKPEDILIAGMAGLVACAMEMAAGEFVSVCSQSDTECDRAELSSDIDAEMRGLTGVYIKSTADAVARQSVAKDALAAHALDELGIFDTTTARPVEAARISAIIFIGWPRYRWRSSSSHLPAGLW